MAQLPYSTCYSKYSNQKTLKSAALAALFVFWDRFTQRGRIVGFSKETIESELQHTAKLNTKNLGELAELAFMRKAASLGFAVAKPWGDSDRYDVIVRFEKIFWRVQVKSVITVQPSRHSYRVKTTHGSNTTYSPDEIDFLVAYVFPKDVWYIFPATVIESRDSVCVRPESPKCRLLQYREAWDQMKSELAVRRAAVTTALEKSLPGATDGTEEIERPAPSVIKRACREHSRRGAMRTSGT